MWHASIARWTNKTAPLPLSRWGDGVRREAKRILAAMLDGVGQGETVEQTTAKELVVHHRRSLTDDELRMLSPEWLAIPAQDEFGPDGLIETRL